MKQIAGANGKVWQSNKKFSAYAGATNSLKEKIRAIKAKAESSLHLVREAHSICTIFHACRASQPQAVLGRRL